MRQRNIYIILILFLVLESFFAHEINVKTKKKHETLGKTPIVLHPEVKEALDNGKPVVALESTIITHGSFIII